MNRPVLNLHNHTPFSDGAYTFDEICEAHLALKDFPVGGVGFSDHLFCTPTSREVQNEREFDRLFGDETRRYVAAVHAARQRWAGRLAIYCGAEINWPLNRGLLDHIRTHLTGVDYVLFEYVDWAGLTQLAHQARRFPCAVGLAHTDVTRQFPTTSLDQVVRTLANARIFYEINARFLPLHGHERWLQVLPQHRVQVSLGTDTHDDLECIAALPKLHAHVQAHGLSDKLLVPGVTEYAAAIAG